MISGPLSPEKKNIHGETEIGMRSKDVADNERYDVDGEDFKINENQLMKVLGLILEGTCRPFKVRLEQVLASNPGMVTFYKLATMLQFYASTLKTVMKDGSSLIACILECREMAMRVFYESLTSNSNRLLANQEPPGLDLAPSELLSQSMLMLRELLNSHSSSLIGENEKLEEVAKILSSVIDPLLQMCEMSASALNVADRSIYMINCLYSVQTTLALYESASAEVEILGEKVDSYAEKVVSEEYNCFIAKSGIEALLNAFKEYNEQRNSGSYSGSMSNFPGLAPQDIKTSMVIFDSSLSNTDSLVIASGSYLAFLNSHMSVYAM